MKKSILFIMMLFLSFMIYACSAGDQSPNTDEVTFGMPFTYSFTTMTYANNNNFDIFYGLGDPYEDFVILYESYNSIKLTEQEASIYEHIIDNLASLSSSSGRSIGYYLSTYTSTDLKNDFDSYEITMTIDDIVAFNNLKSFKETVEGTSRFLSYIEKPLYIELRFGVVLTDEELSDLDYLQYHFNQLMYHASVSLLDDSFEDIISIASDLGYTFTEEQLAQLESGYNIIHSIAE